MWMQLVGRELPTLISSVQQVAVVLRQKREGGIKQASGMRGGVGQGLEG